MKNKLFQLQDITKAGKYIAVTGSGKTYPAIFNEEYACMFFAIPSSENIIGYQLNQDVQ